MKRTIVFLALQLIVMSAHADSELRVPLLPEQLTGSSSLGAIEIDGVGSVRLTAQKNGNQLIVHAEGPNGNVIGKAESIVGLRDTPIYVKTSKGLEKITIFWGTE